MKPITPKEAAEKAIPDFVIEAVNELIVENFNAKSFMLKRSQVVERIKIKTEQEFRLTWLDFESKYTEWVVTYEGPSIGDNFEPYYTFKAK